MRHMYLSQICRFIKAVESLWVVEIFGAEGFLGAMDGKVLNKWLQLLNEYRDLLRSADHMVAVARKIQGKERQLII
jgi:hypothetical protein